MPYSSLVCYLVKLFTQDRDEYSLLGESNGMGVVIKDYMNKNQKVIIRQNFWNFGSSSRTVLLIKFITNIEL